MGTGSRSEKAHSALHTLVRGHVSSNYWGQSSHCTVAVGSKCILYLEGQWFKIYTECFSFLFHLIYFYQDEIHFKVSNSAAFSVSTMLGDHPLCLALQHFYRPTRTPHSHEIISAILFLPSPGNCRSAFRLYRRAYSECFICMGSNGAWVLRAWLLSPSNVFTVHPRCSTDQYYIPFCDWIIVHCAGRLRLFIHSSVAGHLGCF